MGIPAEETANPAGSASSLSPGGEVLATWDWAHSHTGYKVPGTFLQVNSVSTVSHEPGLKHAASPIFSSGFFPSSPSFLDLLCFVLSPSYLFIAIHNALHPACCQPLGCGPRCQHAHRGHRCQTCLGLVQRAPGSSCRCQSMSPKK